MKVLIAETSDPLAGRLRATLSSRGEGVVWMGDSDLFTAPMAYERNGVAAKGFLWVDGDELPLSEVSGVLLRPRRDWWPAQDLDMQDQMFVYHETTATWFAFFAALDCPVANRFELGWWLHDLGYPAELGCRLGRELGLATAPPENGTYDSGRLAPRPLDPARSIGLYLVGERVIPRCGEGHALADRLRAEPEALRRWRQASGVVFCRLDFEALPPHRLEHVEVLPSLEEETPATIDRLSTAMAEVLT